MVNNTICVSNPLGDYSVVENQAGSPTTAITAAPAPSNVGPGTTAQCGRYYLVATGDDCSTISLKFSILLQDFYFLNPEINGDCTNLLADVSYCIQPVGDISTYPGYSNSATHALPAFTPGPSTPLTWEEPQTASNDTDNIIIPLANATREDCWDYMWINDTRPESVDCWGIADYAGVDRDQFALWNPSLDQNPPDANSTSYDYACSVATSVSYCIAVASPTPAPATDNTPPTPRAAGEIEGCIAWMPLTDAVPCDILVANIGLPFNIFYQMNPSIGSQCTSLSLGTNYCISTDTIGVIALDQYEGDPPPPSSTGTITSAPTSTQTTGNGITTPTPTQSGMTPRCNKFYKIAPGDGCYDIANNNNIALNDFYAWNPAVGTDCGTLYLDYYVCIGVVIPTSTTAPPTTTTSATVVSPPGPTQPGIAPTCNKYVMQQAGVYCYDMAVAAQISLDQLYTWNPALNGDCSGLWTGYAYCVGTS
ncbi:hypothetical protein MMC24_005361 [Lignoscripta atroalba]|nr:hypothetical protein [Lignoscripta atroalba]